jgi:hypothetical protein
MCKIALQHLLRNVWCGPGHANGSGAMQFWALASMPDFQDLIVCDSSTAAMIAPRWPFTMRTEWRGEAHRGCKVRNMDPEKAEA